MGYIAEKDDGKDDEKTTKETRNRKTLDKGYDKKRITRITET
jgi:hypothetical protein